MSDVLIVETGAYKIRATGFSTLSEASEWASWWADLWAFCGYPARASVESDCLAVVGELVGPEFPLNLSWG